jgi:hypothetical protein
MAEDARLAAAGGGAGANGAAQPPLQAPLQQQQQQQQQPSGGDESAGCSCCPWGWGRTGGVKKQPQPHQQQLQQQQLQQLQRLGSLEVAARSEAELPRLPAAQLDRLSAAANVWALASHLYWGIWAIVQVC